MLEYHSVFCKKVYVKIKNILQSRKGKTASLPFFPLRSYLIRPTPATGYAWHRSFEFSPLWLIHDLLNFYVVAEGDLDAVACQNGDLFQHLIDHTRFP